MDDYSLLEDQPPYNANIVLAFHNIADLTCCHAKGLKKNNNNIFYLIIIINFSILKLNIYI